MKIPAFVLITSTALFALAAPALASPRTEIESANAKFMALAAQGNASALAELYAKDGAVMPAGSEPIRGAGAIAKFWQGAAASGVTAVDLKTVEVYPAGKTATEVGEYTLHDKSGKVLDHGKYIVIWRHDDGGWKLLRDMFSTNLAPSKS